MEDESKDPVERDDSRFDGSHYPKNDVLEHSIHIRDEDYGNDAPLNKVLSKSRGERACLATRPRLVFDPGGDTDRRVKH
ncbi:hypothetical protein PC114_g24021 [Phytophthora cactorum]|nr:hypothetical protein PC114_g24021 [Phytophthora cactorum]